MPTQSVRSKSVTPAAATAIPKYRFLEQAGVNAQVVSTAGAPTGNVLGVSLDFSPSSATAGISLQSATAAIPAGLLDGSDMQVESAEAIAAGARVSSDNTGRAILAVAGNFALGTAIEAATGTGQFITISADRGPIVA